MYYVYLTLSMIGVLTCMNTDGKISTTAAILTLFACMMMWYESLSL
ncbi:Uncharacterised protein [Klebsiella pneumoniae]|nr:Uncharacterised protein [Klebsiella pneumoniae]VVK28517.1 Uncharacterised protein [Klebsiella pneumoniae]